METQMLLIIGASFAVGAILGAFIYAQFSSSAKKSHTIEQHLHKTQDELKNYQTEVTQHFAKTAELLKNMAESYRDVHNHLAQGANTLSNESNGGIPVISKLPHIDTIKDSSDEEKILNPPLDYAPKHSPYDRGTLHSDHHLEKVELNDPIVAEPNAINKA